jgi:glycosyltransferase involved in cell wall biosynthesis
MDRPLCQLLLARTAVVAALTEDAAAELRGGRARRVELARPGADPPTRAAVPPSLGRHVLFAGYIASAKGLDVLLASWEQASHSTTLELIVAGGPAHDNDIAYAETLRRSFDHLPRVRWLGSVDDECFSDLIASAAIVCLPYRYSNPFSAILAHAMSEGRAIVATSVPAVAETVDGSCALIVPPGDVAAFTSSLERLLRDPALRDRLGCRVAARASNTTWSGAVDDRLRLMLSTGRRGVRGRLRRRQRDAGNET